MYSGCDTLSLQILFMYFWHCHPYFILKFYSIIFTPRACARGKVIGRVVVVVVVSTKIAISRDVDV